MEDPDAFVRQVVDTAQEPLELAMLEADVRPPGEQAEPVNIFELQLSIMRAHVAALALVAERVVELERRLDSR